VTALRVTEAAFQQTVIDLAHMLGWKVAHFRPARTEKGWRTPVAADGAGFPDLVLVRERVVFMELKSDRGRLSVAQRAWLDDLSAAGVEAYCFYPDEFDAVRDVLGRQEGHGA